MTPIKPTTIISAARTPLKVRLERLLRSRALLHSLVQRELRVRYKQTTLGILWALAPPLFLMLTYTWVFSHVLEVHVSGAPYWLFVCVGLVPWTFVSTGSTLAMRSLVENVPLVTRVAIERSALPLASVVASFFDMFVAFVFTLVLLAYVGYRPGFAALWLVPTLIVQLLLSAGLACFSAALNVRFRDLRFLMPLVLQLWFYATPVVYPLGRVPAEWRFLYLLNPLVGIVHSYRASLLGSEPFDFRYLLGSAALSASVLVLGMSFFWRIEANMADQI